MNKQQKQLLEDRLDKVNNQRAWTMVSHVGVWILFIITLPTIIFPIIFLIIGIMQGSTMRTQAKEISEIEIQLAGK